MSTERERVELLQGTLDLLVLRTLLFGPAHGHAIVKAIEGVLAEPKLRTRDLGGPATTAACGKAVAAALA